MVTAVLFIQNKKNGERERINMDKLDVVQRVETAGWEDQKEFLCDFGRLKYKHYFSSLFLRISFVAFFPFHV